MSWKSVAAAAVLVLAAHTAVADESGTYQMLRSYQHSYITVDHGSHSFTVRHPAGHEHDHLQQRRPLCRGRAQQVGVPGVLPQLGRRHFPRSAVRKRRR